MLCLMANLALLTGGYASAQAVEIEGKCCGRYALALVVNFLDAGKPAPDLEDSLPSTEVPFSFAQLEAAAKKAGYESLALNWSTPHHADLTIPCVRHVKTPGGSDHFIACFGSQGDKVLIGDCPAWPRLIPRSALLRIWSGNALYLGLPGSGDLGRLHWQARKSYIVPFLWTALGSGLAACAWLTWREKHARRPKSEVPAKEVTPR